MAYKKVKNNSNYTFETKDTPPKRMGEGDFANMPKDAKFMGFSGKHDMRDGIINGFTCEVSEMSGIEENGHIW